MKSKFSLNFSIACCMLFLIGFIGTNQNVLAQQTRARYNLAGYAPSASKRIVVVSDVNYQGQPWSIKDQNNNTVLTGTVGASTTGAGVHTPKAFNHIVDISALTSLGTYSVVIGTVAPFSIEVKNAPYKVMTHEVLSSLRARRSGSNDAVVHGFSHGEDATAPVYNHDGSSSFKINNWSANGQTVDMLGGWYDAGDYIKFTQTIAYTAYNLLLAYVVSPATFDGVKNYSQTGYEDMLDEIKFGLDYLSKTMPDNNTFIIQVADEEDHNVGLRMPENDTNTPRPALNIKSKYQLAHTAAALALGYTVFKDIDPVLANGYLSKAQSMYAEAKATSIDAGYLDANTNPFYKDNLPGDQMCLAATELYIATGQANYLTDAESYIATDYWASWANVTLKANYRLAPYSVQAVQALDTELSSFKTKAQETDNVWNIPHSYVWGSLYSQFGVGAAAFSYKLLNPSDSKYDDMAMGVLDYTFGINNWGVGFVASQSYPGAIATSYAQIFRLQPQIFPTGEIAEGPAPADAHQPMRQYFSHNDNLLISGTNDKFSDFNTSSIVYFENENDFVCSETTIAGLSDGVLLLAMASSVLNDGGAGNIAPSASPGTNQTLPQGSTGTTLDGSGSNDPDNGPSPLTYSWSQIGGQTVTITNANSAITAVNGLSDGATYTFRLTVSDGELNDSKVVQVTVGSAAVNIAPVSDAGSKQTLAQGTTSTVLDGSKSNDPDNGPSPLTYSWSQVTGPTVNIQGANTVNPTITGLVDGTTYSFQLIVNDGSDDSAASSVEVEVNLITGGSCLLSTFNVPRTSPISDQNTSGWNSTYILGDNPAADALRSHGFSSTSISYSYGAGAIYYFGIGGNGQTVGYWTNLTPSVSNTLKTNEPTITFSNSNIAGLDGTYYVNEYAGGGWVLVHNSGGHAIVLTSGNAPSDCGSPNARIKNDASVTLADELSVYPNPALNSITIQSNFNISKVRVLNLNGAVLQTVEHRNIKLLDLSGLQQGIYFLQLTSDKGTLIKRIIKK
ncbi:glycoside hydrolase family 9 protein [Flammeovirga aprica]|uniref:T9SS type A sorting domain-containing protein n=1 Tax=Flammeovirga aprica JL-4 TaxID=694437 RepID=A0A7X9RWM3_9BACT|nr:glycoside hydrolase family 9 protein [Flammeovirga aprica]NME70058.1 T9SS type A sorting domain-containing protein [Flammeovirga aprica JL-4]